MFYILAVFLFTYLTFGIVRSYFKRKFDDEGRRIDMNEKQEGNEEKKD